MSIYTGTVLTGATETRYDVRATTTVEARGLIAARAAADIAAVKNVCRVGSDFGDPS